MSMILLNAHILVAIVFVGSVTVAASVFPRYARQAFAELPVRGTGLGVARMLHVLMVLRPGSTTLVHP